MLGHDPIDRRFAQFCRTGDPEALADVFDRTAGRLMRVALWLAGNRPDAEDLLQRTFLKAIETSARFELGRPALPWLLGLLGNQARQHRQERQRRSPPPPPGHQVVDAVAEAAARELEQVVGAVRERLGATYSEVLRLHLEEGLNGKEIAERLGRPAGTVRTQLVRALELLRRRLPGGFVAGLAALVVVDEAALAAVRGTVLEAARAAVPAAVGGLPGATTMFGGLLMAKKLLAAVTLLILGGVALWSTLRPSTADAAPGPREAPAAAAIAEVAPAPAPVAGSPAVAERTAATPAVASGEAGFAVLRVVVRREVDRAPVAGIWVHADRVGGACLGHREAVADAAGVAQLAHLEPGAYYVAGSLFEVDAAVALTDGELRTLEVFARDVASVAGRVVDEEGRPVAGARLWLSRASNWSTGGEVGRSAPDGSFRVGLSGFQYLGAQADGQVPSWLEPFEGAPGRAFEGVELRLRGAAARLQGLVVDRRGRPVPWATVFVGVPGGGVTNSGTRNFVQPNPERCQTGPEGRFEAVGLPAGNVPLGIWATGFGPHRQVVVAAAGQTATVTVTLEDGAVVAGVVRDQAGQPVAGAMVRFGDEFQSFPWCATRTDAQGHFRLENLPAAPLRVPLVASTSAARAEVVLQPVAGTTTEWNPVLGTGRTIRGIVLGPGDVPLQGAKAGVVHPSYQKVQRWFDAAADGSFELQQVGDNPCSVQVALGDCVLREVRKVAPGTTDLQIRLDPRDLPTAHLRGRIVDASGAALEGSVSLLRDRVLSTDSVPIDPVTGAFAFGPMSAGRRRVVAWTRATGQLPLGTIDLQAGETLVLPDRVVVPGGDLELTVLDADGHPVDSKHVTLRTGSSGAFDGGVVDHGKGRIAGLQPGSYLVEVQPERGTARQVLRAAADVHSGRATQVAIQGRLCQRVQITFRDPGPADPDRRVEVFCRNEQGVLDAILETFPEGANPLTVQGAFAPGRYQLECRVDDGRVANSELVVPSLDQPVAKTIDLPAR